MIEKLNLDIHYIDTIQSNVTMDLYNGQNNIQYIIIDGVVYSAYLFHPNEKCALLPEILLRQDPTGESLPLHLDLAEPCEFYDRVTLHGLKQPQILIDVMEKGIDQTPAWNNCKQVKEHKNKLEASISKLDELNEQGIILYKVYEKPYYVFMKGKDFKVYKSDQQLSRYGVHEDIHEVLKTFSFDDMVSSPSPELYASDGGRPVKDILKEGLKLPLEVRDCSLAYKYIF